MAVKKRILVSIWIGACALAMLHVKREIDRPNRIRTDRSHTRYQGPVVYPPKKPKRVIVIAVDTLRADHISGYGYPRSTTPTVDKMARKEGIVFEHAYSASSWTLPSSVSLLTSLYPNVHEVEDREQTLHPLVPTLAGAFSKAKGWLSAAFITHIYVSSLFGVDSGFDEFYELSIDWGFREGEQLRAAELNKNVMPWLSEHRKKSFFLYLHYFDPHWDYDPPDPYDGRFTDSAYTGPAKGTWEYIRHYLSRQRRMPSDALNQIIGLYDGEIAYTDHHLGELFAHLKSLGMWDDTLLVLLADHGEEFQDHDSMHHIRTLYEEVLHVPLIIKLPGGRPKGWARRISARVSTVDVGPTLLDLSGKPIPESFQGDSLVPLLKAGGPDRDIFARTMRHSSDTMALIMDGKKLILPFGRKRHRAPEYYDLEKDPVEHHSMARAYPREVDFLEAEIERRLEENAVNLGLPGAGEDADLSDDQKAQLKNLGYMD